MQEYHELKIDRIGHFTKDRKTRKLTENETGIPVISNPIRVANQNLIAGFEHSNNGQNLNYLDDQIESLQNFLAKSYLPGSSLKNSINVDCVLTRGCLKRVILGYWGFDKYDEGMKVKAVKYKGVVFLKEEKTAYKIQKQQQMGENLQKSIYGGLKFEEIVTENFASSKEYYGIFTGHFPKIKVMYTAEIDGVYQEEVELKTKGRSSYFNQEIQQKDMFKWFNQCRLAQIRHVIVGLHENFILKEVKHVTLDIMKLCIPDVWLNRSYKSTEAFLCAIKSQLDEHCEGTVLTAEREANMDTFALKFDFSPSSDSIITGKFKANQWK